MIHGGGAAATSTPLAMKSPAEAAAEEAGGSRGGGRGGEAQESRGGVADRKQEQRHQGGEGRKANAAAVVGGRQHQCQQGHDPLRPQKEQHADTATVAGNSRAVTADHGDTPAAAAGVRQNATMGDFGDNDVARENTTDQWIGGSEDVDVDDRRKPETEVAAGGVTLSNDRSTGPRLGSEPKQESILTGSELVHGGVFAGSESIRRGILAGSESLQSGVFAAVGPPAPNRDGKPVAVGGGGKTSGDTDATLFCTNADGVDSEEKDKQQQQQYQQDQSWDGLREKVSFVFTSFRFI